jgi:hypothetical protein
MILCKQHCKWGGVGVSPCWVFGDHSNRDLEIIFRETNERKRLIIFIGPRSGGHGTPGIVPNCERTKGLNKQGEYLRDDGPPGKCPY